MQANINIEARVNIVALHNNGFNISETSNETGLCILSANHLRKHLGESPDRLLRSDTEFRDDINYMLVHDLKIIATSMGLVQYACVIVGCMTENPSLFIPHLAGQLLVVTVKILNALLLLVPINTKAIGKLSHKIPAIMLMMFNWLQEFCVFRQYLCICDL